MGGLHPCDLDRSLDAVMEFTSDDWLEASLAVRDRAFVAQMAVGDRGVGSESGDITLLAWVT